MSCINLDQRVLVRSDQGGNYLYILCLGRPYVAYISVLDKVKF